MPQLVAAMLSLWLLALSSALRPQIAACPAGHDLRTGIRRDGSFACWPHPVGNPDFDGTFGWPERSVQPLGVLESRLHCTGGARPVVVSDRVVGCQR